MELKIRLSEGENEHIVENIIKYWQIPFKTFTEMFLPKTNLNNEEINYTLVKETEPAHICIVGIQHENNNLLRTNEINILFCIENLGCGRKHYKHFNKFKNFNNDKIDLYIYNHYKNVMYNINTNKIPIMIPVINYRINYFNNIESKFINTKYKIKFNEKKFCLFISQNTLNDNKLTALRLLNQYKPLDLIQNFPYMKDKSCYNSEEIIKLFSNYKFIICFENSHNKGYVTEKIFNVFLSQSIAIYDGDPNINDYINKKSYIKFDEYTANKIQMLDNNEELYERILQEPKINKDYNVEIPDYIDYYLKEKTNYK